MHPCIEAADDPITLHPPLPLIMILMLVPATSQNLRLTGPDIIDKILQKCWELFGKNYWMWEKTPGDDDDPKHGDALISSLLTKLT